ncbi:glycosyltransferase family 2 protein [Pseudooceanicola sp. MF1-13]|uniref:glycosyltransferase family 2 protein n=1 Tax=Pseudooceanicola sp. MF1-13 TaxID=3379095 RepID=UPI003891AB8F
MTTDTPRTSPAISIGMPVYNGADFLSEAVHSLLEQTFTDFELIISDNGSTDTTEVICRAFAEQDSRVRYVRQAKNLGAAGNFLFVLSQARAPYFMWAAHDDVWDRNWISELLPIARKKHCVAFGRVQTIDAGSNTVEHPVNHRDLSFTGPRLARRMKYYLFPSFRGRANTIYGIYPKDILTPYVQERFRADHHAADVLMMYRVLENCEIVAGTDVTFSKRRPVPRPPEAAPIALNRKKPFRHTMLTEFLPESSRLERILLIFLYPIATLSITSLKLSYQIRRSIRHATKRR